MTIKKKHTRELRLNLKEDKITTMNRRTFIQASLATAVASAQDTTPPPNWGTNVIDMHLHMKAGLDGNLAHIEGCGVSHAVLLLNSTQDQRGQEIMEKHKGKFWRFSSANAAAPNAIETLTASAKNGAIGFGEMKSPVAIDSPEMQRVFALAGELGFPVTFHVQEIAQSPTDTNFKFNYGLNRLPDLLKKYPKTTFIGHADFFWANISADVPTDNGYPTTKVKPGGLTDKMLADYPNLYGDLSANSGRNSIARDTEFSAGFLTRHQNKLMFGSDCGCNDGRGGGQTSTQPLIKGKCVARETLTAIKAIVSPEVFKKIAWSNAVKLLKLNV
jgi:predicted TIM-barrel fold metal-dependent hydrolase